MRPRAVVFISRRPSHRDQTPDATKRFNHSRAYLASRLASRPPTRGDDAIRFENRLKGDNAFALREQQRAQRKAAADGSGLKPTYCDSRYYRILAGGNSQGGVGCGD